MSTSPTTTGAMASGSDAVSIRARLEQQITWRYAGGCPSASLTTDEWRIVLAALAAPAPVVPDEVRRAFAAATQGDRWAVGDDEKGLCVVRNGNLEEVGEALPWDAKFLIAAAEWVRTAAAGAAHPERGPTPEAMLAALDRFTLRPSMQDVEAREDDTWLVIDTTSADPETNWPGELVSEHRTHREARVALMRAVMVAATPSKPVGDGCEVVALRAEIERLKSVLAFEKRRNRVGASAPPAGGGAAPAGWRLVPVEPTEEMLFAVIGLPPAAHRYDQIASKAAHAYRLMLAAAPAAPEPAAGGDGLSQAARDVLAERRRQVEVEGWTPEHDDRHNERELGLAAACYASAVSPTYLDPKWSLPRAVRLWPWDEAWWKPSSYRRNLVKAGALILAEIDRLDRAAEPTPANAGAEGGQA